jgi:chromosome segregation ATPase
LKDCAVLVNGLAHTAGPSADEIERLTKGWEGLEYEASAQIASLAAAVNTMHKEAIEQEKHIAKLEADYDECYQDLVDETLRANAAEERIDKLQAVVDKIADGEPGVPYSCIDVRGIAKAAREDDE